MSRLPNLRHARRSAVHAVATVGVLLGVVGNAQAFEAEPSMAARIADAVEKSAKAPAGGGESTDAPVVAVSPPEGAATAEGSFSRSLAAAIAAATAEDRPELQTEAEAESAGASTQEAMPSDVADGAAVGDVAGSGNTVVNNANEIFAGDAPSSSGRSSAVTQQTTHHGADEPEALATDETSPAMARPDPIVGTLVPRDLPPTTAPAAGSAMARGDVVQAPTWRIGARWIYDDGYGLQVEAVEGGLARLRRLDDPRQWQLRRGFLREASQSATRMRRVLFRSIPAESASALALGQPLVFDREYVSGTVRRVHATSWSYEGRQRISVPAGEFDTHIVVMRTRNRKSGWTGFERWWYSPEAGNYVRLEYRYGNMPIGSRVLVDFHSADGRPPALPRTGAAAQQGRKLTWVDRN